MVFRKNPLTAAVHWMTSLQESFPDFSRNSSPELLSSQSFASWDLASSSSWQMTPARSIYEVRLDVRREGGRGGGKIKGFNRLRGALCAWLAFVAAAVQGNWRRPIRLLLLFVAAGLNPDNTDHTLAENCFPCPKHPSWLNTE